MQRFGPILTRWIDRFATLMLIAGALIFLRGARVIPLAPGAWWDANGNSLMLFGIGVLQVAILGLLLTQHDRS